MGRIKFFYGSALVALATSVGSRAAELSELKASFQSPPAEVRLHSYWWWLNGNVTAEAITRDVESMKEKGFGGALITDAGGASQDGNRQVPKGPLFGSQPWRELYRHALREAKRLDFELALNIQSGWNLGGPGVTPEDAAKLLGWTETTVTGPGQITVQLPAPPTRNGLLREVAVVAVPERVKSKNASNTNVSVAAGAENPPLWKEKTLLRAVKGANNDVSYLVPGRSVDATGESLDLKQIINLSEQVDAAGKLTWNAPAGTWRIYRFGYTVGPGAHVSTCTEGWEGLALDPMSPAAFQRYWDSVVEPLMLDAQQVGGKVLKYLHTDSWEIEPYNWTAKMPDAFKQRCGYNLVPWLPVFAGRMIAGQEASERFLHDFRKTVAELTAEGYYGSFLTNAHRHGLQVRAESGGPHGVPVDAQHCLGMIDVPMSEFWATSWRHRVPDAARFFVKQPASAAHTYGKQLVAAEGFTTIGPHWQETVWDNLRPNFDRALCEGLNQLLWTLVTCSPPEMGLPGQEMFPGTHFNPNSTWWRQSEGFLAYINRCQLLLRQGHFVADVLYYYGDIAPNFAGLKASNPAQLPAGYDYDVASEHVLLHRVSVKDGRIVLPDGMSYAALVLPPHRCISLPVLRKLDELAKAGAVLIGAPPDSSSGLVTWQAGDAEARTLIASLWSGDGQSAWVKWRDAAAWLKESNLLPDFVGMGTETNGLNFIHRRDGGTDIYFVSNPAGKPMQAKARFRVPGKIPEFWNPVDGTIRVLPEWRLAEDGRIEVTLALEAFGSGFLVFQTPASSSAAVSAGSKKNFPETKPLFEITGPWKIVFDPAWFYLDNGSGGRMVFEQLVDWTQHADEAVRHYSGAAVYRTEFNLPAGLNDRRGAVHVSLGAVREMARVTLNGRPLGITWCPPWQVPVPADLLTAKGNRLEVEVVNFWPNRLIGDAKLPAAQRRTRTNITKFENPKGDKHYTTLMPSGLLGPVRIVTMDD